MEQLIEQAKQLVANLQSEIASVKAEREANKKQADAQGLRQVQLDDLAAELLDRESKIAPIENIGETQRLATQSKAEADLEWTKIRAEWDKLANEKAKSAEEIRIAKEEVKEQKALYDRGAKENLEAKNKLDEKLKKFNEATGRV